MDDRPGRVASRRAWQVIEAFVNGVVRFECLNIAIECLVDTEWAGSVMDRVTRVRKLQRRKRKGSRRCACVRVRAWACVCARIL
jgi:hypothetical protein